MRVKEREGGREREREREREKKMEYDRRIKDEQKKNPTRTIKKKVGNSKEMTRKKIITMNTRIKLKLLVM